MPASMILCGIDPGLDGAICTWSADRPHPIIYDMPTVTLTRGGKNKREIDVGRLIHLFPRNMEHAYLELAGARPGQNASGVFASGKNFGIIIGILFAKYIPFTIVHPRVWKKALGVPKDKDGARARASQLMPQAADLWPLKKHDGRAEAALIALWGRQQLTAISSRQT